MEFCHHYLTHPTLNHANITLSGIDTFLCDLSDAPTVTCDAQLRAITELHDLLQRWDDPSQFITVLLHPTHHKTHSCTPKLRKSGGRDKSCQPLTPPPRRVHNSEVAAQYPRVRIPAATASTPRVETSDPREETPYPRVNTPH